LPETHLLPSFLQGHTLIYRVSYIFLEAVK
jgi:hypothetical protein